MLDAHQEYFAWSQFSYFLKYSILEDATEFSESSSAENNSTLLDDSLAACGVSPFKSSGKLKCQKLFHANKKIEKVTQKLEQTFSTKRVNIAVCSHHQLQEVMMKKILTSLCLSYRLNFCNQLL